MAAKVHTYNQAGQPTPTSLDVDDDGAPPALPAGGRVHFVNGDGDVAASSGSPSQEVVDAIRARVEVEPPLPINLKTDGPLPAFGGYTAPLPDAVAAALIAKFPDYDPTWPAKTQAMWFDGFAKLMSMTRG